MGGKVYSNKIAIDGTRTVILLVIWNLLILFLLMRVLPYYLSKAFSWNKWLKLTDMSKADSKEVMWL